MTQRVIIFSPAALLLEHFLSARWDMHLLASYTGETDVWTALLSARADIALLDDALPGQDILRLMRHIKSHWAAPPRVIYLGSRGPEALKSGADAVLPLPVDEAAFLDALNRVKALPLSSLAQPSLPLRTQLAEQLLDDIGMPAALKGTRYLKYALPLLSCQPNPAARTGNALYALLANRFQSSPAAVERAIRTAIETTWLTGQLDAISTCFGYTVDPEKGKPTNTEFLSQMALHLQRNTQKEMLKALQH